MLALRIFLKIMYKSFFISSQKWPIKTPNLKVGIVSLRSPIHPQWSIHLSPSHQPFHNHPLTITIFKVVRFVAKNKGWVKMFRFFCFLFCHTSSHLMELSIVMTKIQHQNWSPNILVRSKDHLGIGPWFLAWWLVF